MSNTSEIKGKVDNLWTKVLGNAGRLHGLLGDKYTQVESLETDFDEKIAQLTNKLHLPDKFLKASTLKTFTMPLRTLILAMLTVCWMCYMRCWIC
jgi:hypothetical protein